MDRQITKTPDMDSLELDSEEKILEEFNAKKIVKPITFDQSANSFCVPELGFYKEKIIYLEQTDCEYKRLLFSLIYTTFYRSFIVEDQPKSRLKDIHTNVFHIMKFLNEYKFREGEESKFFRDYESHRVNDLKIKPSSSGLSILLKWVREGSEFNDFRIDKSWQYNFIESALRTKAYKTRPDDTEQFTLTEWFGYSTWLRRDDVGIGHELYCRLASPKALVSSFIATICVQINEIQLAKDSLIDFFRDNSIKPSDFPLFTRDKNKTPTANCKALGVARYHSLKKLKRLYCSLPIDENKYNYIKLALLFVIREFVFTEYFEFVKSKFFDKEEILSLALHPNISGKRATIIRTSSQESLFGLRFLRELAQYSSISNNQKIDKPKSLAEQTIFTWLMAYQTVQPADITKLRLKDFRFVRRNNGRVTHVDLQYFKGRANTVHQVRTLEANTLLGSVVLKYTEDLVNISKEDGDKKLVLDVATKGSLNRMFEICDNEIAVSVNKHFEKENASPVFIKAMLAIIRNGILRDRGQSYREYVETCERRLQLLTFSLTAIKNSSVHSRSDTFTPTQLVNYHSHSNKVEKDSYLTESNEEWKNNAGLITRSVMHDLTVNLFRASETDRVIFNSEFTKASDIINNKKRDILVKMKLITAKEEGNVNHLGLVKKTSPIDGDSPDTIYVLDTAETVMKLFHYRDEVKKKHHLLAASAPEFLLFTVLPTIEWIEELLDKKSFSKESLTKGEGLYQKYKKHLSPLFQNQIR